MWPSAAHWRVGSGCAALHGWTFSAFSLQINVEDLAHGTGLWFYLWQMHTSIYGFSVLSMSVMEIKYFIIRGFKIKRQKLGFLKQPTEKARIKFLEMRDNFLVKRCTIHSTGKYFTASPKSNSASSCWLWLYLPSRWFCCVWGHRWILMYFAPCSS